YLDRRRGRRVLQRIVKELSERQPHELTIGIDHQAFGDALDEPATVEVSLELLHRRSDNPGELMPARPEREVARIDPQHLNRVGNQRTEMVQLFVDKANEFAIFAA